MESQKLAVQVPEGAEAGDTLQVQTPNGDWITVVIPENAYPGALISVSLAPESAKEGEQGSTVEPDKAGDNAIPGVEQANDGTGANSDEFSPSPVFAGARPGMVFKMGERGLGYYVDSRIGSDATPAPQGVEHDQDDQVHQSIGDGERGHGNGDDGEEDQEEEQKQEQQQEEEEEEEEQESKSMMRPIGDQVEDEAGVTSIQIIEGSLCMACGGVGRTTLLPTVIPYFRDITVCHFKCDECGYQNSEAMEMSTLAERGVKIVLSASDPSDLNRRLIKAKYATIQCPELDLTIPSMTQQGTMTTIEGILTKTADHLRQDQEERRRVAPEAASKLDDVITRLVMAAAGLQFPFSVILDDPSGCSHIESPFAPEVDPRLKVTHYIRTPPQNKFIGLPDDTPAPASSSSPEEKTMEVKGDDQLDIAEASKRREGWIGFDKEEFTTDEMYSSDRVTEVTLMCSNCGQENGSLRTCQTNIPHFRDVVIMSFTCPDCGYKSNEIKAGGGVPEKGRRFTLTVTGTKPEDMHRDLLKSNTAVVKIPELNFEMGAGSLGGLYTTVEGLLGKIHERLAGANPFAYGDSADPEKVSNFQRFLNSLRGIQTGTVAFTLILEDPLDHSFIYSPADDGFEDNDLVREFYERSAEENEEHGILDMRTENYCTDGVDKSGELKTVDEVDEEEEEED